MIDDGVALLNPAIAKFGEARKALDPVVVPDPNPIPTPTIRSRVGYSCHIPDDPIKADAYVARLATVGCEIIRDDLAWAWMEPSKGSFNFSRAKLHTSLCKKYNMKYMAQIGFCPQWANNSTNDKIGPLNVTDFGMWAKTLGQWFVNDPVAMEVLYGIEPWNESNWTFLINPVTKVAGDPVYGTAINNAAYDALHPLGIKVIGGALANVGFKVWNEPILTWWDAAISAGIKFDEPSVHPYEFGNGNMTADQMLRTDIPNPPSRVFKSFGSVESLAALLKRRLNYTGKIHITEFGAPTNRPDGSWAPRGTSEANQAELVKKSIPLFLAYPQMGNFFFYSPLDSNSWGTTTMEDHFGHIRSDGVAKPAFAAFKEAIRLLRS